MNKKNWVTDIYWHILAGSLALSSLGSMAGDKENRIIDNTIKAYGGEKLTQISSLELTDTLMHFSSGQSGYAAQGAMSTHLQAYQLELAVDFKNKRKMLKRHNTMLVGYHDKINQTITHQLYSDNKGYVIDHCLAQYEPVRYINLDNVSGGFEQMLDPLIVKQLDQDRERARWVDVAYIQGQAHDVLIVNGETKQAYTLFINQATGYLSRVLKQREKQAHFYDFLQHNDSDGITWAKQLFVSTAQRALYYSNSRQLKINAVQENSFSIPDQYLVKAQEKFIDDSKPSIRELAEGVYFAGQNWGYTLFVDVGDYYISAGAWHHSGDPSSWQEAVSLLRRATGNNKPIKQHLVSHHHTDHMSGLPAVINEGANLVIHSSVMTAVNDYLQRPLATSRFLQIEDGHHLADGKVVIYDVPNSHADHNLVMYLPEHKILFTEDMFGSSLQEGLHSPNAWPSVDTYPRLAVLSQKLALLNLDVEQYVSSHHFRILNQLDIQAALNVKCL